MSKDFFTKQEAYVARAITLRTLVGIKNISVIFDDFCYNFLQSEDLRETSVNDLILIEFLKENDGEDNDSPLYTIVCSYYNTNKTFFSTPEIKISNTNIVESISLGLSFICHMSQVRKRDDMEKGNEASAKTFLRFSSGFSVLRTHETVNHSGMSYGCVITHNISGYLVAFQIALYVGDKPIDNKKKQKSRNKENVMKRLAELGKHYAEIYS